MQYNPNDLVETPPIKEGTYRFKVANAQEKTSKSGNAMIELELCMIIDEYRSAKVFDYLVSTPAALFKIKQFCHATGLDFNNGNLNVDDVIGRSGNGLFMYETQPNGKKYLRVRNYATAQEQQPAAESQTTNESNIGDDIPF